MHSYLKQIERLQKFAAEVAKTGCDQGYSSVNGLSRCVVYNINPKCLACRAEEVLEQSEPVSYVGKLMETGEGYEQPVLSIESPARG